MRQNKKCSPKKFQDQYQEYFKDYLDKKELPENRGVLTREQTAKFFNVNQSTLKRWTDAGLIQAHGIGNRVYYKLSAIEKALIPLKPERREHND